MMYTNEILTLQSENLLLRVHDGRVRRDGSSHEVVRVCQVDDDDLVLLVDLFSYANEVVRLERKRLKA